MNKIRVMGLAAACLAATPALALDQGDYMLNGFGTAALTHIGGVDDAKSYGREGQPTGTTRGDQMSKLGGQFSYGLFDKLTATVQAVAKPEDDHWQVDLEWAYLAYEINDEFTVRGGRLRPGAYMFSETLDVSYSYPWLRLPDEVYSMLSLSNYEGLDMLYNTSLPFGSLSIQLSAGQAVNRKRYVSFFDDYIDLDLKNIIGGAISLETNDYGTLRYSYLQADVSVARMDYNDGDFSSLGYKFDDGTWVTNAELASRTAEGETVDAFYILAGRRFGDFMPHITYGQQDAELGGRQSSWTYGLNYSLAPGVTLKGEYKRVDSTDGYAGAFAQDYTYSDPTFDGDIISIGVDFVF
ncbi:porin [Pseudomaricurvus sp.]|uniref:porin n=1 Tax=Pseudomaricurvus sp. TaxID=2004510 RepID=UPI003F6A55FF